MEEQSLSGKTIPPAKTSSYPQWVVVDLASHHDVMQFESPGVSLTRGVIWSNTGQAKIHQAANRRRVVTFQGGEVTSGNGVDGDLQARLRANNGGYLRMWMTQSSNTCNDHGLPINATAWIRNSGIYLGTMSADVSSMISCGTRQIPIRHDLLFVGRPLARTPECERKTRSGGICLFYTTATRAACPR